LNGLLAYEGVYDLLFEETKSKRKKKKKKKERNLCEIIHHIPRESRSR